MLKFVYIQNFELILNILDHLESIISSLKPPGGWQPAIWKILH